MKKHLYLALLFTGFIASLSAMDRAAAQEMKIFKHPILDSQCEAPADWKVNPYHNDELIYEFFDPDKDVHTILWYTTTEQSGRKYLEKMASMKDVVVENEPVQITIKGREAWLYDLPGVMNKKPIRMLLAVIPDGKSEKYPRENALHIVQIWCPGEDYEQHKPLMESILYSVEIINN